MPPWCLPEPCPPAALGMVFRMDVGGVAVGVAATVISAGVLGVANLLRPRWVRNWRQRRAKRLCAQGRHTWRQIDKGAFHDGRDGPSRDVLISCTGCGQTDTVDLWDI